MKSFIDKANIGEIRVKDKGSDTFAENWKKHPLNDG